MFGRARNATVLMCTAALLGGLAVVVAGPADAVTGTLTVTTLDRTGHAVRSQFGAVDVRSGYESYFWTGAARRLPTGVYDIYAAIPSASSGDTVGVKRVTVSGAAHLTIDARQGRAVRGFLSPAPPSGFLRTTSVWLCASDGTPVAGGGSTSGPAYVIPSSLPEVEFAFSSVWSSEAADNHAATYYAGAAVHRHGAPAGMTQTFQQANLTRFAVRGRTGLQTGDAQVEVRYANADECRTVTLQLFANATLPYTLTMHVPAGGWYVGQLAQDGISGPVRQYATGHSYTTVVGGAAWGPSTPLPSVDKYCRCLTASSSPMFTDPAGFSGAAARVDYTLKRAGTTIAQKTVTDSDLGNFVPKLPAAGWYSLLEVATRHPIHALPSNVLSPRSVLHLHFYADPGRTMRVGGFVTRFAVRGLTMANQARTQTTTVTLKPHAGHADVIKTVSTSVSTDGGRTWHAVSTHHRNGTWWVTITNPHSGYVSLRTDVVDTLGNSAVTTVVRAYASAPA